MVESIHILRYGTLGDHKSILNAKDKFDYLAVNANMIAHTGGAVARYICQELKKPYFIDPLTYAFQQNIELLYAKPKKTGEMKGDNEPRFKTSIRKLVDRYTVFRSVIDENRPITLDEMEDGKMQQKLCEEVMDFQMSGLREILEQDEMMEYLNYESDESARFMLESLLPVWITAPYFYLEPEGDWLEVNLALCEKMSQLKECRQIKLPIMAQLLLSKEVLKSETDIERIARAYADMQCDGYLIWIDGLDEIKAEEQELRALLQLLRGLGDKPKYNMYGGFFSILLTNPEIGLLKGASHGLEYGENRSAFPVGGGIPSSKFYFLPLHQRLNFQEAFRLLSETEIIDLRKENWGETTRYFDKICKCQKCRELMKDGMIGFNQYQSTNYYEVHYRTHTSRRTIAGSETKENCRAHYLACKKWEFLFATRKKKVEILETLEEEEKKYRVYCEPRIDISYMEHWRNALRD